MFMSRSLVVLALAGLAAGPASAQRIEGREESTFTLSHRIAPGDWVRIASPNGFIRITGGGVGGGGGGDQVEIRAEKEVRRGSIEDVGFVVRRGSGGVTICAVYDDEDECDEDGSYRGRGRSRGWWRDHQIRVSFTARIPAGARVRAATGNGDVSVSGAAEAIAASGNGRVDVSGVAGEVEASSGNGRITVEGAGGPVDASSGNGDIRVTTASGPVSASSGNGSIEVTMDQLSGSPDMSFSTGNGRIIVRVPDGFGAELDSHTGNGRVSIDFPIRMRGRIDKSRVRGTIGDGGGRLTLSSGNGNLEVLRVR
jgi:hypothetical protein